MKLLYVLERYPELSQTFVAQEILGLLELGCDVRVVALESGSEGLRPVDARIASDWSPRARIGSLLRQAASGPKSTARQILHEPNWPPPHGNQRLRGALRIASFAADANWADHVHAHFATEAADIGRLLAATAKRPFSFTAHGADAYSNPAQLNINLRAASFARGASPHVAEMLRAACTTAEDRAKVVEIPVAVDTVSFARRGPYRPDGDVLSVGRLVDKKGFSVLISAFASVQDSGSLGNRSLIIIGDGPLRSKLHAQAQSLGARVRFQGSQPPEVIAQQLEIASLFALTPHVSATGDRDGRPTVLIEAMAAGLPVLSTAMPGIRDLIRPDIGLMAAPDDVTSVARSMSQILDLSPSTRESMGLAGQAVSKPYARQAVASSLLECISQLPQVRHGGK